MDKTMSQHDPHLNVPNLGPAKEPSSVATPDAAHRGKPAAPAASEASRGGWFTSLVLILLTAACSGLGYLVFDAQQKSELREFVLQTELDQAKQRIAALETLLSVDPDNAAEDTPSVVAQLQTLESLQAAQQAKLDTETAKLWEAVNQSVNADLAQVKKQIASNSSAIVKANEAITQATKAGQRQAGTLEQLSKAQGDLSQQLTQVQALQAALTALEGQLKTAESTVVSLQTGQEAAAKQAGAKHAKQQQQLTDIQNALAALRTHIAVVEESVADDFVDLRTGLKQQDAKLAQLQKQPRATNNSSVVKRVKALENDINAIDASRRNVNRELLAIKKRINNLQARIGN